MRLIPILALFAMLSSLTATQAAPEQNPFNVTSVVSTPYLSPEDRNVGIEFIIQNNEEVSIDNIRIYLFLRDPFSASVNPNNKLGEISNPGYLIGNGGSEYASYFNLPPKGSRKTVFKIDVDRSAKYGAYDIPYSIYYDEKNEYNGKITLAVKGNTLIEILDVSAGLNSSQVEPGEVFKLAVSFENVGDNDIKWLKLTLTPRDKELLPLKSDSEQVYKDMPHGSKEVSEFWFSIEKDAAVKNYPIDLILNYLDERGVEHNETKLIGIVAAGRAKLDIAKKTTEPSSLKQGQQFTISMKIENSGTGDAKGVIARLESELGGDTIAYLGEIKRDDYSNAIFTLDAANAGKRPVILKLSYEDSFGKHDIQKELVLVINPSDQQNVLPLVIGIITIGIPVYFWKKRKN
ncbi:MAG: hypothetical protein WA130_21500 [Candidatus Methanoperedens sp.]